MRLYRSDLATPCTWPPAKDGRSIAAILQYCRERDRYGHLAHATLGAAHAFTLPLAHAPAGITFAVLVIYAVARLPITWRCYTALLRQPLLWLLLLFAGWYSLSVLWSADRAQGLDEMGALRMLTLPLLLWPVLDRAPWLIGSALLGVFAHNLVQFGQYFEIMGLEPKDTGRVRGMLHPIQTGAWCAAAVCWHLSALLHCRGRFRLLASIGLAAALAGLVISGSRGPWLALLAVVPIGLVAIPLRTGKPRDGALVAAVLLAAIAAGAVLKGEYIQQRMNEARTELRDALDDQVYTTSVGLRIGMWSWALEISRQSPWIGTGAGSFRVEATELDSYKAIEQRWPQRAGFLSRAQPHSSHLQVLQATGLIGLAIFWGLLACVVWQSWSDRRDHCYVDGTLLVALVWIIAAQFDSFHLSGTVFGMLTLAAAVSMRHRFTLSERNSTAGVSPPWSGSSSSSPRILPARSRLV